MHRACYLAQDPNWRERLSDMWVPWVLHRGLVSPKEEEGEEVIKEKVGDNIKFR